MLLKGLLTVLACDVLFVIVAVPLMFRKVPRNRIYGYRTRATLGSDVLWYETNARFGQVLLVSSLVAAPAMYWLYRASDPGDSSYIAKSLVVLCAPVVVAGILGGRRCRELQRSGAAG